MGGRPHTAFAGCAGGGGGARRNFDKGAEISYKTRRRIKSEVPLLPSTSPQDVFSCLGRLPLCAFTSNRRWPGVSLLLSGSGKLLCPPLCRRGLARSMS